MPKNVAEEYAELTHYTSAAGLFGIISSDCLWASHAAFLNDAQELTHFFDERLYELAGHEIRSYAEYLASDPENAKIIEADGGLGPRVENESRAWVAGLRTATLTLNNPFVFSMSGTNDPLVQANGLLSQWRGYGVDGGYAITFDTKGLDALLQIEESTYMYQHALWGDVHYYGINDVQPSSAEVEEAEATVRKGIAHLVRGGTAEETEGFYQAISSLSCLFKHWGFREEREVRIVAIPTDRELADKERALGDTRIPKTVKAFPRGGLLVPFIELFYRSSSNEIPKSLPIKRVIVGPHAEAAVRARSLERLLVAYGYKAEVVCSTIPYIGR